VRRVRGRIKRASELHVEPLNKYPGRFELVEGDFLAMSVDEIVEDLKGAYGHFLDQLLEVQGQNS
jgi:hypothetical protein